jgi:hypothetical protein
MVYLSAQGLGTTARSIFTDTSITITIFARVIEDRFPLEASGQAVSGENFTVKRCTILMVMKPLEKEGNAAGTLLSTLTVGVASGARGLSATRT